MSTPAFVSGLTVLGQQGAANTLNRAAALCKTSTKLAGPSHGRHFLGDVESPSELRFFRSSKFVARVARDVTAMPETAVAAGPRAEALKVIEKRSVPKMTDPTELLSQVDTFLFDCDGVVWRGDEAVEGAGETIDYLRSLGKRLIFVTNNSTKSRAQYLQKFIDLGLNVNAEDVFASSFAAAAYLESINFKKKAYLVGEQGIQKELDLVGIPYVGGPQDADKKVVLSGDNMMEVDHGIGAVVVGFDRNINYYKIQYAVQCLREIPGCMFIATNQDAVTHLTSAQEWAGAGSMVGAIRASSGVEPVLVGKPAPFMLNWMTEKFQIRPEQICMVGDRLDTDILFGKDGGLTTMLVLTGVTSEQYLLSPENKIVPDRYADSIAALIPKK